ncbi:PREDICTED: probable RNA polymerase II nuclear localization protein SLC7A6OS [Priapulus caudatus]|uniref:Probable RNA polymerase II nuclear localization protein SLC7A6OS n=1 Tax=Priapulus caudatus TaxID=37621 RepID=A0ABM1EEQ0_PRICU|nr:PREDICTED: probable RNA polymerase II nuclear localization protein SLC7A6OS [Priapulus caudatus]
MAGTVIRVKRKRKSDPVEKLVVSSKRRRPGDDLGDDPDHDDDGRRQRRTTVFHRVGTVTASEQPLSRRIREALQHGVVSPGQLKLHQPRPRDLARRDADLRRHDDRYQLLVSHRGIPLDDVAKATPDDAAARDAEAATQQEAERILCLYDVVRDGMRDDDVAVTTRGKQEAIACNGVEMSREPVAAATPDYVYDLYCTGSGDAPDNDDDDDDISIEAFDENYVQQYPECEASADDDDDDDSNDENNWRNDYPDSDPDGGSRDEDEEDEALQLYGDYAAAASSDAVPVEDFARFTMQQEESDDDDDDETPGWAVCI